MRPPRPYLFYPPDRRAYFLLNLVPLERDVEAEVYVSAGRPESKRYPADGMKIFTAVRGGWFRPLVDFISAKSYFSPLRTRGETFSRD